MGTSIKPTDLELAVVIVDFGLGSKVLKLAKQHGIQYGIVFVGSGTLNNRILEFLRLADIRKEIVLMASDRSVLDAAMDAINERFRFDKPFHGIAYTKPLSSLVGLGSMNIKYYGKHVRRDVMYQSLMVIVDRGKAEQVMETATKAGARGGTIMKARSAADDYDSGSLFNIDIEPEKEVVIILVEATISETIADAIREAYITKTDGSCVILCQDVNKAYGVK